MTILVPEAYHRSSSRRPRRDKNAVSPNSTGGPHEPQRLSFHPCSDLLFLFLLHSDNPHRRGGGYDHGVIGEIFDKVYIDGSLNGAINYKVQTTTVPSGGAVIVEFVVDAPGAYRLVDHSIFRVADRQWNPPSNLHIWPVPGGLIMVLEF